MSELRLAVGRPDGLHSVSWRVWANNHSMYVLGREMKGSWKVSVHPPSDKGPERAFLYGFPNSWLDKNPDGMIPPDGPNLERYFPREQGPGVTRFATIRTHGSVLQPTRLANPGAKIVWFEPPPLGKVLDLHLLLVEPRGESAQWCRENLRPGSVHSGIVNESVLGDLLVVAALRRVPPPGIGVSFTGPPEDLTVVAFGIQSSDGSLLIEQTPTTAFRPSH